LIASNDAAGRQHGRLDPCGAQSSNDGRHQHHRTDVSAMPAGFRADRDNDVHAGLGLPKRMLNGAD